MSEALETSLRDTRLLSQRNQMELQYKAADLLKKYRETLTYYADMCCEYGISNEGCGKYSPSVCSGCIARSLVNNNN